MLTLLAAVVILGIIVYFVEMIPMGSPFPQIVRAVAVIIAIVLVLRFLGVNFNGLL